MHFGAEVSETFRHWCRSVSWTLLHQRKNSRHFGTKHNAEMSWVRSVLGPKCPYTGEDVKKAPMIIVSVVCFLTLNTISTGVIAGTILNHLQQLSHYFYQYFDDDDNYVSAFDWIRNPFEFNSS